MPGGHLVDVFSPLNQHQVDTVSTTRPPMDIQWTTTNREDAGDHLRMSRHRLGSRWRSLEACWTLHQRSLAAESSSSGHRVNNKATNGHSMDIYTLGIPWTDAGDHDTSTRLLLEVCGCPVNIISPLNQHQMDSGSTTKHLLDMQWTSTSWEHTGDHDPSTRLPLEAPRGPLNARCR